MKRNGFTLVEILAVLIIMSVVILIVTPSMTSVYNNFKNSNNEALFEQLYKAGRSYYLEDRASANPKLVRAAINVNQDFLYQSWKVKIGEADTLANGSYKQVKINITDLSTGGFIKPKLVTATKDSLGATSLYLYLIGRVNSQNTFVIIDYALDDI